MNARICMFQRTQTTQYSTIFFNWHKNEKFVELDLGTPVITVYYVRNDEDYMKT